MQQGDFVLIDFIGRVSGTHEIFDLTVAEVAKQEKVHSEKAEYKPALVIVGANLAVPAVESAIQSMEVGEEREFEVLPKDGFGMRSPQLVKTIPLAKFREADVEPMPGAFVEIDNMPAKIMSVASGRVRADFNNPLAGRQLHYWVKVLKNIEGAQEKAAALLDHYNLNGAVSVLEKKLEVKTGKDPGPMLRFLLQGIIMRFIPGIEQVEFALEKADAPAAKETTVDPSATAANPRGFG